MTFRSSSQSRATSRSLLVTILTGTAASIASSHYITISNGARYRATNVIASHDCLLGRAARRQPPLATCSPSTPNNPCSGYNASERPGRSLARYLPGA